jgi:hypothetical protein
MIQHPATSGTDAAADALATNAPAAAKHAERRFHHGAET